MTSAARLARVDPIYGSISRAVPRGVDPLLREDIMSDIYLAIREGELHPRDIRAAAHRFVGSAYRCFANKWGAVSLDALTGDDDTLRLVDLIEDPAALAAFDNIEFRQVTQ